MTVSSADPQPLSSIPFFAHSTALVETDQIGEGTRIWAFGHVLKGAEIGCNCNVGDHCYIEGGAKIGNEVVIKNGVSIWTCVIIEDRVFVGPNVAFTNDLVPRAKVYRGEYDRTQVKEGASIGANATLLCPLTIGRHALVGAGAVVTHDIPDFGLVYGNPARLVGFVCKCGKRLSFALDQDGTAMCQCGLSYEKRGERVTETASSSAAHGNDRERSRSAAPSHNVTPTLTHSIPLVDLRAQHDELRPEIEAVIRDIIDRSCFIGGSYVEVFEHDFAAYCGAHHTVGCASGTDALRLALMAAGVRPGDEVLTVPFTFIATVEAITQIGAHPVFVDIDLSTYTLNSDRLTEFLEQNCHLNGDGQPVNIHTGRRVAAVIPVHLYGLPADMDPIMAVAERYRLKVIEDACQAHGALHGTQKESRGERDEGKMQVSGRRTGTLGHVGCFSFYPGKNLGAMGEAGALVTNDPEIAEHARILRDHGQRERYVHISPLGWNGRLDAIQAAVLSIKLRRIDEWNERRRQVAQWYNQRLADRDISLPVEREYGYHVYHLYVIRVSDRDRVRAALAERGIATGLHYPIPLHLQDAYRHLGYREGDFPVSEEVARSVLSLPMYPHLNEEQVDYVCRCLDEVLSH